MEEKAELLRTVLRVVMMPLRTPSLVRDLLAAFVVALLVSGFVTTSLRVQIEAQQAQIVELRHQLAELRTAPQQFHALEEPDGICVEPEQQSLRPATTTTTTGAATGTGTALTDAQVTQLLGFLNSARELADTFNPLQQQQQQQQQRRQSSPPTGTGTKQERWTTVLVAALILVVAVLVIFTRFW